MSEFDVRVVQDEPDDARERYRIYKEGIETRFNEVAAVKRTNRRLLGIVFGEGLAIVALAAMAVASLKMEKVYVYQLSEDNLGRGVLTLVDKTYTADKGDVVDDLETWVVLLRTRTLDRVADRNNLSHAQSRVTGSADAGFGKAVRDSDLPEGFTRIVERDSFSETELSGGEGGYLSWVVEWTETEWRGGALRSTRRMLSTFNVVVRPPDAESRRRGNKDGVWIAFFDIQEAPKKDRLVTSSVANS